MPNYFDRVPLTDVFESVALYQVSGYRFGQGAGAEGVSAMNVTPSFFQVLRAQAARGRLFSEEEGTLGKNKVAVLSHDYAARKVGDGEAAVGREIRLNDEPYTVVGVLSPGFSFLNPDVRVFVPLAFTDEERSEDSRYSQNHEQIARLAPGVALSAAQARIDVQNERNLENAGTMKDALTGAGYRSQVVFLEADLVRNVRAALQMLWGGVCFVLLIAAVNVTNLSLVRANARRRELATRSALGAGRARLTRQLVTETLLLTALGGALGLLLGAWSLNALTWLGLSDLPRAHEIRLDGTVLALTAGLAVVLGIVVGAVPALQAGRSQLAALNEEGRGSTAGRGARAAQGGLVVSQVALAFLLLAGAGLLLESFRRLLGADPGFVAQHVLTGRVSPLRVHYPDDTALRTYAGRALERVRALPGVEAAGISSYLPFSWDGSSSVIIPEGYTAAPGDSLVSPNQLYVTPGYLEAMRVPLKRGRTFNESDGAEAPRVVIVDEQLAAKYWPNADPVGRRVYFPKGPEDVVHPGPDVTWFQVVGVVGCVKLRGLVEGENARVGAYLHPLRPGPDPQPRLRHQVEHGHPEPDRGHPAHPRRDRPRAAAVRRLHHDGAGRAVAQPAARPHDPLPGLRGGGPPARHGRPLRRARLPGAAEDAGDRGAPGPGQRAPRDRAPRAPRRERARRPRPRGRPPGRAAPARGDRLTAVRRGAVQSLGHARGDRRALPRFPRRLPGSGVARGAGGPRGRPLPAVSRGYFAVAT